MILSSLQSLILLPISESKKTREVKKVKKRNENIPLSKKVFPEIRWFLLKSHKKHTFFFQKKDNFLFFGKFNSFYYILNLSTFHFGYFIKIFFSQENMIISFSLFSVRDR